MQFTYPIFLWSILALMIPIIIHLFHFRRFKKVYFTNVNILKEIKEQRSTRSRIRSLLVLLMRMLALAFLIFAFSQPILFDGDNVKVGKKSVSIYIDNSFSMNATKDDVSLINIAKNRALHIIEAYGDADEFQILTNELNGRQLNFYDKSVARKSIDEITASPQITNLGTVSQIQKRTLNTKNTERVAYMISDFQQSVSDFSEPIDSTIEVNLLQLKPLLESNLSIDYVHFEADVPVYKESNPIVISVTNHSDQDAKRIPLTLQYKGESRPLGSIDIPAGATVIDTARFAISEKGWHNASVKIEDYPVQFDDEYYFSFRIKEKIEVLAIYDNEPNPYLSAVFESLDFYNLLLTQIDKVKYESFLSKDLIILDDLYSLSSGLSSALQDYVEKGGHIVVFPNKGADIQNYNEFFEKISANPFSNFELGTQEVGKLNEDAFVFTNVFRNVNQNIQLPKSDGRFKLNIRQSIPVERILDYRDGEVYMAKYKFGKGSSFISCSPLKRELNDITSIGEIFVPFLYRAALLTDHKNKFAYVLGEDFKLPGPTLDLSQGSSYQMKGNDIQFIPGLNRVTNDYFIDVQDQVSEKGFYSLYYNEEIIEQYAFNHNRIESDMNLYEVDDLKERIAQNVFVISDRSEAGLTNYIVQKDKGFALWKYCIVLALLFLGLETIILRFWKT